MAKRAVRKYNRSGVNVCPIRGHKCKLVKHHIHGRDIPDAEAAWNVCWISPEAHDRVHAGEIIIEGWFMTSEGRQLIWRYSYEEPKLAAGARPPLYTGAGHYGHQPRPEERQTA